MNSSSPAALLAAARTGKRTIQVQETSIPRTWYPSGVFPLLEVPTGNAAQGLGSGHLQAFLPLWAEKSWGFWTSYGGGGYRINPGAGKKDYWLFGWLLQKDLSSKLTLGNELYYTTPSADGAPSLFNFNLGGQYNFDEGHHFLFSAGRSIHGDTNLQAYLAYQWTFGPKDQEHPQAAPHKP